MHIYGIQKNGTDEPICRAGVETLMQKMDMWTQAEEGKVGYIYTHTLCVE